MDRTERFYKIDQLITERRLVAFKDLLTALEVSPATLKRDLEYMRNRLRAPIVWDRDAGGYRFDKLEAAAGAQYELPGLWFSSQEIHALLTMQHLLASLDPGGLLAPHVAPLQARLNGLLGTTDDPAEEIRRRVLIFGVGKRNMKLAHFEKVGSALLRRKRIRVSYFARGTGEITERELSPQRLVHYRENWYLDAWCHLRGALRNFSVDAVQRIESLETPAREVPRRTVERELGPGYGIFVGRDQDVRWARLAFSAERARWVASEHWHPQQKGTLQEDGRYVLELPYTDDRELLMDILKYGADVTVLAPETLRERVVAELARMNDLYR
ncbi:helix-turn-helix transcriptional regulator [Aromatoleum petrolei]|uniref:WYL domain-containing protein n=1 Tax=Aromatoleum petrolei TaxID=76116 RepID=A0ABX1MMS8_9RHOO|nr:YafY family protein [Aromatoleum petrolei]NMF87660.1 WYL domain-containing protein [Aromatoleum petrolei]QTQ38145.1 WYL domain-containing protein [Aromatoleum petrolei]